MPSLRHDPVRTCVGCREEAGKRGLIRLVRGPDGIVRRDPTGRAHGRGAYVHDDPACLELARKRRALQRALKSEVPDALWEDLTTAV
ncbi:MAG: YlxR family protein [Chloroflexi bacterium]|nr:MAG: YlxR family protein [Chloroflexota bacterium]